MNNSKMSYFTTSIQYCTRGSSPCTKKKKKKRKGKTSRLKTKYKCLYSNIKEENSMISTKSTRTKWILTRLHDTISIFKYQLYFNKLYQTIWNLSKKISLIYYNIKKYDSVESKYDNIRILYWKLENIAKIN